MIRSTRFLVLLLAAVAIVVTGCDSTGTAAGNGGGSGGTILINKDNQTGNTVPRSEFTFEYGQGDIVNGTVVELSDKADGLGEILSNVAADRSDVIAARVDSVVLRRVSTPGTGLQGEITPTPPQAKVFDYLGGAEVFFGSDTDAPRIARRQFQSSELNLTLNVDTETVTGIVQQGARPMTLRLDVEDPSTVSSTERVSVTVWFELEISAQ